MAKSDKNQNQNLAYIEMSKIAESPVALRKVDKKKPTYPELVESIRKQGVLNPVVVREVLDKDSGKMAFALVDGLHRFTAAQDAGLKEIPCHITKLADAEVLEAQIVSNLHKIETKPREYADSLIRLFTMNPLLTLQDVATSLSKSTTWVSEILKLNKIKDKGICDLINSGEIKTSAAQALAELPEEEQKDWCERAMTMPSNQFREHAKARVKEVADLKRKGKATTSKGFLPVPFLKGIGDFKKELEGFPVGAELLRQQAVTDPLAAWQLAIQWATNMDPVSLAARQEKWQADMRAKEERKIKEKAERDAKKSDEAKKKADELATLVHQ